MDLSLVGCARCFVPPTVMLNAFDALRIVCFWEGGSVARPVVLGPEICHLFS